METLYQQITKSKEIQKETKEIEKLISKYLNQKNVKKTILNGLKENKYITYEVDHKTIELKPDFVDCYLTKCNYKYKFIIKQNDEIITYLVITPALFNSRLNINLNPYTKEDIKLISSKKIIEYLKNTIGIINWFNWKRGLKSCNI